MAAPVAPRFFIPPSNPKPSPASRGSISPSSVRFSRSQVLPRHGQRRVSHRHRRQQTGLRSSRPGRRFRERRTEGCRWGALGLPFRRRRCLRLLAMYGLVDGRAINAIIVFAAVSSALTKFLIIDHDYYHGWSGWTFHEILRYAP